MTEPGGFLGKVARAELRSASGDWAEAAALWGEVTAANPVNGDYWAHLAEAQLASKDYEAAHRSYGKVLELGVRPEFRQHPVEQPGLMPGEIAYRMACCLAVLGGKEEAIEALAVALGRGYRELDRAQGDECWKPWLDDERLRELLGLIGADGLDRDEGWRADLRLLAREIKRKAYAPFAVITEDEFDRRVARLDADVPGATDAQVLVRMMELVRHLNDGHAGVRPPAGDHELSRLLPLEFFLFPEGLFVTAAGPGYEALPGARVDRIGRLTTEEAIAALDPVIVRDNEQQVLFMVPAFLRYTAVLNGLGITDDLARVNLTIRAADRSRQQLVIGGEHGERLWDRYPPGWTALAGAVPGRPRPLHLRNRELPYWFEYLDEADLVYFQFNAVRDHPAEPFDAFCERLFGFVADRRPGRLVIDLRWNGGGNTFLTQPLLHHLIASPALRRRGALFVIIGRQTFSAAQNTATAIGRETNAIFAGEPTGSRPNFIGETIYFELPYSKVRANAADLYWQTSWPDDYRAWIAPDLYAPPTFEAFSRDEDPAMDAILGLSEHLPGS